MGAIGTVRVIAVPAVPGAAVRNATALPFGEYLFRVDAGGPVFARQGDAAVVVDTTTGHRLRNGDAWTVSVSDDAAAGVAGAFLSIIAEGAAATVRISRVDQQGVAVQPPAWA